jgi:membrane-associated PAP2 superfamily phosphatase
MVIPYSDNKDDGGDAKLCAQYDKEDTTHGGERRIHEFQEAWNSHRHPEFPEGTVSKGFALFAFYVFRTDSGGKVSGMDWVFYAAGNDYF